MSAEAPADTQRQDSIYARLVVGRRSTAGTAFDFLLGVGVPLCHLYPWTGVGLPPTAVLEVAILGGIPMLSLVAALALDELCPWPRLVGFILFLASLPLFTGAVMGFLVMLKEPGMLAGAPGLYLVALLVAASAYARRSARLYRHAVVREQERE